jgi:hypothetical protein
MDAKEKTKQLTAWAKTLDVAMVRGTEREELLRGFSALLDLGWPSNYIDAKMCSRANEGLVPPYVGHFTLLDYQKRWRSEDQQKR